METTTHEENRQVATSAERLKQIMQERNLKQVDIINLAQPYCEKFGVKLGKSDMSQFVSGKVQPGQWKLTILGLALNVSEAWLMGVDVPMERTIIREDSTLNEKKPTPEFEDELEMKIMEQVHQLPSSSKEALLGLLTAWPKGEPEDGSSAQE